MKVQGSYAVQADPQSTFQLLQDPEVLAKALPGCQKLERISDDEYRVHLKAAIGSIAGDFDSRVKLFDQQPPSRYCMSVEGSGRLGFLKGEGMLTLEPDASSTKVSYEGEVQVGGTIASVGQRVLESVARMMIKRFFDNLNKHIEETSKKEA